MSTSHDAEIFLVVFQFLFNHERYSGIGALKRLLFIVLMLSGCAKDPELVLGKKIDQIKLQASVDKLVKFIPYKRVFDSEQQLIDYTACCEACGCKNCP